MNAKSCSLKFLQNFWYPVQTHRNRITLTQELSNGNKITDVKLTLKGSTEFVNEVVIKLRVNSL